MHRVVLDNFLISDLISVKTLEIVDCCIMVGQGVFENLLAFIGVVYE